MPPASSAILGIRPVGDRAFLVELPGLAEVLSVHRQLRDQPGDGQLDVVAGARTVLVAASSPEAARHLAARVRGLDPTLAVARDDSVVTLDTVYDGEDLDAVAEFTGLGREEVIDIHSGQLWTAAFCGFAPGFAYLVGEDDRLRVPRRTSPRTAVPALSVALAGEFSGVYPRESPGGWQLIGHTDAVLWDASREAPALVRPGNRVRFRPVRELIRIAPAPAAPSEPEIGDIRVINAGLQSTVQDLGRPGYADLGVTGSGAADRGALARANRLAGNADAAAGLEILYGGLVIEALADQVVAVTGATVLLTVKGLHGERAVPLNAPFALQAGERLAFGVPESGLRSYLAFRGGVGGAATLGSRSTDTLSGLGPAPLRDGMRLAVDPAPPTSMVGDPDIGLAGYPSSAQLRFVPGPRAEWFDDGAITRLTSEDWTIGIRSNRVGIRLEGRPLTRIREDELPSEGTVSGAIQVPPDGFPILFLADHPVTGGYPVIGVVVASDLDAVAQLAPGSRVRFTALAPTAAE